MILQRCLLQAAVSVTSSCVCYKQLCLTFSCVSYRQLCLLQSAVSATSSCVCNKQLCLLQSAVSATSSCVCYKQLFLLQAGVSVTSSCVCYKQLCLLQAAVSATINCICSVTDSCACCWTLKTSTAAAQRYCWSRWTWRLRLRWYRHSVPYYSHPPSCSHSGCSSRIFPLRYIFSVRVVDIEIPMKCWGTERFVNILCESLLKYFGSKDKIFQKFCNLFSKKLWTKNCNFNFWQKWKYWKA